MRRCLPLILMATVAVAGCQKAGRPLTYSDEHVTTAAASDAPTAAGGVSSDASAASDATAVASAAGTKPIVVTGGPTAPDPAATPMLAYAYEYGVEAPPSKIRDLLGREQAACTSAGLAACQITGANISEAGRDSVTAKLTLKATPAWLKGYQDRLSDEAKAAGGRLTQSTVTSEDLSRQIVDTQAVVRAKTALRDRLQQMLDTRPGKLEDLVDLEEKLADVQGDLDSTNSELAVMRERIATSDVTIDYDSAGVLAPQGAWSPVSRAVGEFVGILAGSVATMIYFAAVIFPWAALIGLVLWLFRKRLPKFGRRAAPKPAPLDMPKKD
jgi:hypothetical protein